jgi:hypothetical protein
MNTLPKQDIERETEAKTENASLAEMDLVKKHMVFSSICSV